MLASAAEGSLGGAEARGSSTPASGGETLALFSDGAGPALSQVAPLPATAANASAIVLQPRVVKARRF
jgi:hypothetical protein